MRGPKICIGGGTALGWVLAVCGVLAGTFAAGQTGRAQARRATVPALMLSDIHFDPFYDPGKARRLEDAPVSAWDGILAEPASVDQGASFAALQQRCGARGVDTSYVLLRSSLDAARREASQAKFITVSGDLIAHGFGCRYAALMPGKTQGDYAAFIAKTVEYVTGELRGRFPGFRSMWHWAITTRAAGTTGSMREAIFFERWPGVWPRDCRSPQTEKRCLPTLRRAATTA